MSEAFAIPYFTDSEFGFFDIIMIFDIMFTPGAVHHCYS